MTDNTPDAPVVVEAVARLLELMLVRRGVLEDRLEGTLDDAENLLKVLAMLRSCRPIAALPSEDDAKRVALLPWCRHKTDCAISMNRMSTALHICDCGLAAAIAVACTCPPAALPSKDDVERVAVAIAKDIDRQDYDSWTPEDDWDFIMPYLDQGEVNYLEVARVAIAAMAPEQIAEQEPQ